MILYGDTFSTLHDSPAMLNIENACFSTELAWRAVYDDSILKRAFAVLHDPPETLSIESACVSIESASCMMSPEVDLYGV